MLAVAECKTTISTVENFNSSQDSKPMIGFKLDAMSGAYILTLGMKRIPRWLWNDIMKTLDQTRVSKKIEHIKTVLEWKGNLFDDIDEFIQKDSQLVKLYSDLESTQAEFEEIKQKYDVAKGKQIPTLFKQLEKVKSTISLLQQNINLKLSTVKDEIFETKLYTGHNLFSILLPDDFEYSIQNGKSPDGKPVFITRGVLLSGTLDKKAMGSSSGSLIHHLSKDYSNQRACQFVSEFSRLINQWLLQQGFSVGIYDCIAHDLELIEEEINKNLLKAKSSIESEKDPELRELNIKIALNDTASMARMIAKKALKPDNHIAQIVDSGAKGSEFNITQITGMVGQQFVSGNRVEKQLGGRTLPHYEENIDDLRTEFESRGFIFNSYYKGMNPIETFFAAGGGRQGLIDTAIKTADTGYIQRKMIKILEDLTASYVGTVNDASQNVVQFNYGEDNFDASKLIKVVDDKYTFIDISHAILKANSDYEWNNRFTGVKSKKRLFTDDEKEYIRDVIITDIYKEFYTINASQEAIHNAYNGLISGLNKDQIYPEAIQSLYNEIANQLKKSIVNAGEAVGHIAGSSIGERNTQESLNSFHSSGSLKANLTQGLSRLMELMNATKNPKTKSLTVFFDKSKVNTNSLSIVRSLAFSQIQARTLGDFVKDFKIEKEPKLSPLENIWYGAYRKFIANDNLTKCKYRLRLFLKPEVLYLTKQSVMMIAKKLESLIIKSVNFYVIGSTDTIGIIDIWVEENISDPNTFFVAKGMEEDLLLDQFINSQNKMSHLVKKILIPKFFKMHISGVPGVKECYFDQTKSEEWFIQTKGGILKCLLFNPVIDLYRTTCNDMWEIYELFGIEATKKWLKEEFSGMLSVNHRHLDILVDKMTYGGSISSVSIYGLDRKVIGPLSKAVFERPLVTLLTAAQKAELDPLKSVSSCIATGKIGRFGTGMIDLYVDTDAITNNPYAQKVYTSIEQITESLEEIPEDEEEILTIEEPLELNDEDIF